MIKNPADPVLGALHYPILLGKVGYPVDDRILLVNPGIGGDGAALPSPSRTDVLQYWKPQADHYAAMGYKTANESGKDRYDMILVSLPKQREEGLYMLACAFESLKSGGVLVAAAANDSGGKRLKDDLSPILIDAQQESKNKCRVVWGRKQDGTKAPAQWIDQGNMHIHPVTGYWTQAGLFSWDHLDTGTNVLMSRLPRNLSGCIIDAGCGFGALSDHLLKSCPDVEEIICIDADSRAVEACRRNMAARHPGRLVRCLWQDFSGPVPGTAADYVIMNPPFHAGSEEAVALGRSFIRTAAGCLIKGGGLWMVANTHLKYEDVLREIFSTVESGGLEKGFKVIHAVK